MGQQITQYPNKKIYLYNSKNYNTFVETINTSTMLLNTMNDNEILNEIKRDYTSCKEKIKYYHNKFNNSVRNKLFITTDSYKMVTPNGNEWFTFYYGNMLNKYYKHYVFMRDMAVSYTHLTLPTNVNV